LLGPSIAWHISICSLRSPWWSAPLRGVSNICCIHQPVGWANRCLGFGSRACCSDRSGRCHTGEEVPSDVTGNEGVSGMLVCAGPQEYPPWDVVLLPRGPGRIVLASSFGGAPPHLCDSASRLGAMRGELDRSPEPETQEMRRRCPACASLARIVHIFLDPRRGKLIWLYECSCGVRTWAEKGIDR
jgi:hypothetical protein